MARIILFAFVALLVIEVVVAETPEEAFKKWKAENKKNYSGKGSKSEAEAQKIFTENKNAIDKHNKDPKATYAQKVNSDSDKTKEEFEKTRTGYSSAKEEEARNSKINNGNSNKNSTKKDKDTDKSKDNKNKNEKDNKGATDKSKDNKNKNEKDNKGATDKSSKNVKSSNTASGSSPNRMQNLDKSKADKNEKVSANIPTTLDYSTIMPPARDQGQCGSCWAFATVGVLEYWSAKNLTNPSGFSEQNLVECNTKNHGCSGGAIYYAMAYVMESGIAGKTEYPYLAQNGTCRRSTIPPIYYQPNGGDIALQGNEDQLKMLLIKFGPLVVTIYASLPGFMSYSSGIFSDPACNQPNNHAVVLVGYGTDSGVDYWLIRNSWSTGWGMNGYAKIARNQQNMCGIAAYAFAVMPY